MPQQTLIQISECVARGDRPAALSVVRTAIDEGEIVARDGIELMLAVRRGSAEAVMEAVEAMKRDLPGVYRYVPKTEYAVA